jgi:hypothetical protein
MSRIYFHSPHGEAKLHGSERAWLGALCRRVAEGLFNLNGLSETRKRLTELLHSQHLNRIGRGGSMDPFLDNARWQQSMQAMLGGMFDPEFAWKGHDIDAFTVVLNTACKVGNDSIRLAARIHGQCEIHGYVEGINRAWLADLMQAGLDAGLYRRQHPAQPEFGQGWEEVMVLLRARDDEPVVMSYSVCDQFPNREVADWTPKVPDDWRPEYADGWDEYTEDEKESARKDAPDELWYALPDDEKWQLAMAGLRRRAESWGLELKPGNWSTFTFQHGLTALDFLANDYVKRLDRALGIIEPAVTP